MLKVLARGNRQRRTLDIFKKVTGARLGDIRGVRIAYTIGDRYRSEKFRPAGQPRHPTPVVAISCILAARRTVGVIPILSERLKEMALLEECYDESVFEEIGDCYEVVCNMSSIKKT